MATQDGKKIILTDAVEEAKKNKPHDSIPEAASEVFATLPESIYEAYRQGKEKHKGDFFVEVLMKFEPAVGNTVHPYITVRKTCPKPHFKQMVFHHDPDANKLKLLWTLTHKNILPMYHMDPLGRNKESLQYVLDYESGKLDKMADELNQKIKF